MIVVLGVSGGSGARQLAADPEITIITRQNAWLRSIVVDGRPLVHPTELLVAGQTAFVLDGGDLFQIRLSIGGGVPLTARSVMPSGRLVQGVFVHELADMALGGPGMLYVLDKVGSVFAYTWEGERGSWQLTRRVETAGPAAASVLIAIGFFDDVVYLLDSGLGQIHRFPATPARGPHFFPRSSFDAARSMDLAVDGKVYLLTRSGALRAFADGLSLELPALELSSMAPPSAPVPGAPSLVAPAGSPLLYVVDPPSSQLIAVDKTRWAPVRRYQFAEAGPGRVLRSVAIADEQLWALVGPDLVIYPRTRPRDAR